MSAAQDYPEISLNELPGYTDWPARLLEIAPEPVRVKTEQEVLREFNRDKWGELLSLANSDSGIDLHAVEAAEINPETVVPYYESGHLYLAPFRHVLNRHLDLYAEVLSEYATGASALIELGAGFGSKIFRLSDLEPFKSLPLYAAELTPNGRDLIKLLAIRAGKAIRVGACDFRGGMLELDNVPPNAIVFTSFAVHYVPTLTDQFIALIAKLKPKVVVHFEPCIELMNPEILHELMCRSYMLRNDYNRNILGLLEAAATKGDCHIISVRANLMGGNPLLPLSSIVWRP